MFYKNGSITLNRACNLRCKWCYAKATEYSQARSMPLSMAKDIVNLCSELKFRHIELLGGEPTIYPNLIELIDYINFKKLRCGFPTNGIMLANVNFAHELFTRGINNFSISLKGYNRKSFIETTGNDAFDKAIQGIVNCISFGASVVIFMVLSNENVNEFADCVKELCDLGVSKFRFSFVYNFDPTPGYKNYLEATQPRSLINSFISQYPKLDKIAHGHIGIFPTYPACFWGENFIKLIDKKGQLIKGCQFKERATLIFDEQGFTIPCNAMYTNRMGQLYTDFTTANELREYYKSQTTQSIYNKYSVPPSEKCYECTISDLCDPCRCQWTNYTYSQLINC